MQQRSLLVPKVCLASSGQTYSAHPFGVVGSVWFGVRDSALSFPGEGYKKNVQYGRLVRKQSQLKLWIIIFTIHWEKTVIFSFNFLYIMSTVNVWSLLWWRTTKVFTCLKITFWAKSKLSVLQNCSSMQVTESYHRRSWTLHSSSPWSLTSFTFLPFPVLDLSASGFGDFLISGEIWSGAMDTWKDTHWGKAVFSKYIVINNANQCWLLW